MRNNNRDNITLLMIDSINILQSNLDFLRHFVTYRNTLTESIVFVKFIEFKWKYIFVYTTVRMQISISFPISMNGTSFWFRNVYLFFTAYLYK